MKQEDLRFYGEYAPKLEETENLLMREIQAMLDSISTDAETALAEHIKCRIKGVDSLCEKLRRFELEETAACALRNLSDIVGVRVVTHFVGDIYTVLELIEKNEHWKVVTVKDYIANAKPNGYRSLHVLRTIAMDCWASLEHQLKYKKHIKNTELIVDELKRCADEMASTDLSMQTIRDLIQKG